MIKKELFVTILNNMHRQYVLDKINAEFVSDLIQMEDGGDSIVNNRLLYDSLFMSLRVFFPKDKNGFCEIEHYCFFTNFGKENSESDYFSPEQLYEKLCNKVLN